MRALGGRARGTLTFTGSIGRRPITLELALLLSENGFGTMRVQHDSAAAEAGPQVYTVALTSTPCRFGGRRWWFACPQTGQRAGKLYLPNGGRRFLSLDT